MCVVNSMLDLETLVLPGCDLPGCLGVKHQAVNRHFSCVLCTTHVAFPSRRKTQDKVNCSETATTFLLAGFNLSLMSVCVGKALAYCFMLIV